nr:PREDICTED: tigger transposable element-derived protein 1-like [Megachile rotundata]
MPNRTFLSKGESVAPGHKPSKNRLTLLLGGNLAGDLKLKPLLVYQAENPRALKGKNKELLPVIWKSNKNAWITTLIFKDWITQHFVPTVKQYCENNNLQFKTLLILDNALGHPKSLQNLYPEINVVFLPPNTTCLIQPMDQTVIATFKRYYMRTIMTKAIKTTDRQHGPTLTEIWKNYNIWNAINNIGDSWAEIKESTMKGSWKQLCPQMMNDFTNFEEKPETLTNEIVTLMNQLQLDVNKDDVDELIESHSAPLSNEYLIEQQLSSTEIHDESEEEEADKNVKTLKIKNMNEAFTHLDKFLSIMEECDPNGERISQVRRAIEKDIACYRNLYEEKKKMGGIQLTVDKFIKEAPQRT